MFTEPGTYTVSLQVYGMSGHSILPKEDYITVLDPSSSVNDGRPLPDHFDLFPNYPNPFNPVTAVNIALARDSFLQLQVYNLLGEQVAVLADDHFKAGYHSFTWDAGNNQSGIYFIRMDAGDFKKMIKCSLVR